MDRRLEDPLESNGPWLFDLAEPFMVTAIEGRAAPLLAVEGGGGGPIDVRLLEEGGTIDLRVDGVPVREGVEEPEEMADPSCLVGDRLGI